MIAALKAFFSVWIGKAFAALDAWLQRQERDALIVAREQAEADLRAANSTIDDLGRMADVQEITDPDDARERMRGRKPGTR